MLKVFSQHFVANQPTPQKLLSRAPTERARKSFKPRPPANLPNFHVNVCHAARPGLSSHNVEHFSGRLDESIARAIIDHLHYYVSRSNAASA